MNIYECVFILNSNTSIKEVYKISQKVQDLLYLTNGIVLKKEYWGLRSLAYNIKNSRKGHYIFFKIQLDVKLIHLIKKELIINQMIIKFLIVKINQSKFYLNIQ